MLPQIPEQWDDTQGWEAYYREYCAEERWKNWVTPTELAWVYISQLAEKKYQRIWFPGCGASLAPRLYAALGFEVYASDISPTAVDFQRWLMTQTLSELGVSSILAQVTEEELDEEPTEFRVIEHDLKKSFDEEPFDAVVNLLSFHGFSKEPLEQISKVHYQALRPGGSAIFVMGNVSRAKREFLERPLVEAGFYMPYYEPEAWFREALQTSQIPHRFISGRAMVRIDAEPFRSEQAARNKAQETLQKLEAEYNAKMRKEDQVIAKKLEDPSCKVAFVVYG
jgi:SAM-dependent methyltransferase